MAEAPTNELTGLEWEAEKAYIVATSPRNTLRNNQLEDSDEFSWETVTVTKKEKGNTKISTAGENFIEKQKQEECIVSNQSHNKQDDSLQYEQPTATITQIHSTEKELVSSDTIVPSLSLSPASLTPHLQTDLQNHTGKTLIIYGPSGLGISALVKKMVYRSSHQFSLVVSHTTRQPRVNETYARDYYFVSRNDMVQKIQQGKFIEYVQIDKMDVNQCRENYTHNRAPRKSFSSPTIVLATASEGELYGTTWESFKEAQCSGKPCTVLNVSTKGAEQLKELGIVGHYLQLTPDDDTDSKLEPDHKIIIENDEETFGILEEYSLNLIQGISYEIPSQLEKAQEEWDRVPTIQLGSTKRKGHSMKQALVQKSTSFVELLSHFQTSNLSRQLSSIKPEIETSGLSKVFGPPRISKKLHHERNLVFAIALCKYDEHNSLHASALSTIYHRLKGGTTTCPRFGLHWENIGFQGSDPADDLRGVGVLGLVQLVWLLETPVLQSVAMEIYRYSQERVNSLPFCVVSLNITSIALQALREGSLSRECNKREQVFAVFNDFYAAIFVSFYNNWRRHHYNPMELGHVLQDIGNFSKKHARFMIRELQGLLKDRQKESELSSAKAEPLVEFSAIESLPV